jgi:hypothetical protein
MLSSLRTLARATATLLAATACSSAPSPGARDSVALSASVPAPAAGSPAGPASAPATSPARPDSTRPRPVPAPASASFTRILTQRTSGFDEPAELVIRDRAALESAWSRVFNQVVGDPPPAVDFARETVILVATGGASSGGHSVQVDAIDRSGDGAVVHYTATSPAPGCMTTQSLTSPVDVVRTSRIAGQVRFDRRNVVQPC